MQCISCNVEINPKWQHAIEINVCPFCGKGIMEEHLKNLLTSLHEVMMKLSDYPDQLNDWMLSNFNYIKTDSENLASYLPKDIIKSAYKDIKEKELILDEKDRSKFVVKVKTDNGEEEVVSEKIQSDEKTNDFFKRAEVKLTNENKSGEDQFRNKFNSISERTEHLKRIKQQIEQEGSIGIDESGMASVIKPETIKGNISKDVAMIENMLYPEAQNSESSEFESDDDDIPLAVLNMASRSANKGVDSNVDLLKLQKMQARVNSSRKNFSSDRTIKFSTK